METGTSTIERLKYFMSNSGLSNSQFADQAGIPRPTLSQLLHGRNKSINDQLLRKINDGFPQLDIRWLLFGTGNMFVDANSQTSSPSESLKTDDNAAETTNTQCNDAAKGISKQSVGRIPKEISDLFGCVPDSRKSEKQSSSQSFSNAAEPFVYEVRSIKDSEGLPDGGKIKAASKKATSIIVLYSDGSFETFSPSE